jgi:hypothetical protein
VATIPNTPHEITAYEPTPRDLMTQPQEQTHGA